MAFYQWEIMGLTLIVILDIFGNLPTNKNLAREIEAY